MIRKILITFICSTIVSGIYAQSRQVNDFEPGWFVSANGGINTLWSDGYSPWIQKGGVVNIFNTIGPALKVSVGHDVSPVFACQVTGGYARHAWADLRKHNKLVRFDGYLFTVDAIVNVSNWLNGYEYNRKIDFVTFGGIGINYRPCQIDFEPSHTGFLMHFGIRGDVHLSPCVDLNTILDCNLADDKYDSWVGEIPFDLYWGITVGLTYHF